MSKPFRLSMLIFVLWLLAYAASGIAVLGEYVHPGQLNIQLGILALVLSFRPDTTRKGSTRFGWLVLVAGMLSFLLPVKTAVFVTCAASILFLTETFLGRLNTIPLVIIVCMSPVFDYALNIFSFPIRLQLTTISAQILGWLGTNASVEGNTILMAGKELTVDTACMGLNMLTASLLAGLIMLAIQERRAGKRFGIFQIVVLFAGIILLNIFSNLLRITCLTYYGILPENVLHEIFGLSFFIVYLLIPVYFITRHLPGKNVSVQKQTFPIPEIKGKWKTGMNVLAGVLFFCSAWFVYQTQPTDTYSSTFSTPGYKKERKAGNVIQLSSNTGLIYIKPIPTFFSTEHHPMICWRGSGFVFTKVRTTETSAGTVYFAQLEKKNEQLFTAWWYSNGNLHTHAQMEWRKQALRTGKQFYLINITASSEPLLLKEIDSFMKSFRHQAKL